jgi:phospholipase C
MNLTDKLNRICSACMLVSLLALGGCRGLADGTTTPTPPVGDLKSLNHVIFMAQENRSFDTYFGQLPAYWAANGYPAQPSFNGIPATASNPTFDGTGTVSAYHIATMCTENLTPSWDESHLDWNLSAPTSSTPTLDGYVYNAAKFAMDSGFSDTAGLRAMGYYDGTDLPYYYFMASNFATSDMWFSPTMDRTQLNRMYMFAATSQGYAYPPGTNQFDNAPLTAPTIFDALTTAGISWKIYTSDTNCGGGDTPFPCTYLTQFANYAPPNALPANVVPLDPNFAQDLAAGTLPSVALIEGGYNSGRDEHPDNNVQTGAQFVSTLMNEFMSSPSWKDSAFILTYDEAGGLYDHVAPQTAVSPDGIAPIDLLPGDICTVNPGTTNCDFNITGYRVPLLVVSPFTKKNYVSHTVADYTAILRLIEARFGLPALTNRDAAQMDMSEFFDFQNPPWVKPPSNVPAQPTTGTCNAMVLQ